jgi:membrane fusion protein, heavy metal efflux system
LNEILSCGDFRKCPFVCDGGAVSERECVFAKQVLESISQAYAMGGRNLLDLLNAHLTPPEDVPSSRPLANRTPMTDRANHATTPSTNNRSAWRERLGRVWSTAQFVIALALTGGFALYLFLFPHGIGKHVEEPPRPKPVEAAKPIGTRTIEIQKGSSLEKKLETATIHEAQITTPVLTVTGTVAASLRPGSKAGSDFWQFNSPEVLTAFTDWQKAVADIAFAESQLRSVRDLDQTRVAAQRIVVDQMERLVKSGTESIKSFNEQKTILAQYVIQGKKEVYEAETALRTAQRQEAALSRQLQQSGLEPSMLASATADVDIIVADVPEAFLSRMKVGQQCQAHFLGVSDQTFTGKVNSILPVLSRERRTLRLLFVIDDPQDQLRPGMFAEIGVGTDPRDALLAPAAGIVHVAHSDYAMVEGAQDGTWRIAEVQVGEPHGGLVEILSGVTNGERVIGKGAILLKPVLMRSLQIEATDSATPRLSHAESR